MGLPSTLQSFITICALNESSVFWLLLLGKMAEQCTQKISSDSTIGFTVPSDCSYYVKIGYSQHDDQTCSTVVTLKLRMPESSFLRVGHGVLQRDVNLTQRTESDFTESSPSVLHPEKSIVPSVSSEHAAFVRGHHLAGLASLLWEAEWIVKPS